MISAVDVVTCLFATFLAIISIIPISDAAAYGLVLAVFIDDHTLTVLTTVYVLILAESWNGVVASETLPALSAVANGRGSSLKIVGRLAVSVGSAVDIVAEIE